jgi:CheY-like chemotaxis protein/HPt (histidine-containing phosphotransfer) domain-containing protein
VTPSSKGIYSGYGVGLHIALAYAKLLGGDIKLTSTPGVGTLFNFDLTFECLNNDLFHPKINTLSTLNKVYKEEEPSFMMNRLCQVLIVEDNTVALKVAEAVASSTGCRVISAKDAEQALALVLSTDFDLILTDIGLPGMSGYDLTRAIRERESKHHKKSVPIIGLTAHAKSQAEKNCLQAGMNDVYSKPITVALMKDILLNYVVQNNASLAENKASYGHLGPDLPNTEAELFLLESYELLNIDKAIATIGNEDLVRQVMQLMISEEIDKDIAVINAAHVRGNWEEIEKFAHKMKGGAVYIGTVKMQYACQYLERYQKAGHTRLLEPLYQQLITVVHDTQNHIRAWLNT